MDRRVKRMIEKRLAAREGRRFHAFYRGAGDFRAGRLGNPFQSGSEDARCWEAGFKYAESESQDRIEAVPPICRFGPGGDFVHDWPEDKP